MAKIGLIFYSTEHPIYLIKFFSLFTFLELIMALFTSEFDCFVFSENNDKIFCKVCSTEIKFKDNYNLKKHLTSEKHRNNSLFDVTNKMFFTDSCEAFVSASIPFNKLNNASFRQFLAKYTKRNIPDE